MEQFYLNNPGYPRWSETLTIDEINLEVQEEPGLTPLKSELEYNLDDLFYKPITQKVLDKVTNPKLRELAEACNARNIDTGFKPYLVNGKICLWSLRVGPVLQAPSALEMMRILKLDNYFEFVPETIHRRKTVDDVLAEVEADPFGLETKDPSKERKMKKFLNSHTSSEVNTAVSMYMVGAIEFFKKVSQPKVKELAFEFATLGITGIDPNKDGYSIPSIKNKTFTGYQALAYYYVSWAIAIPEMLAHLQMPFDKEYELANQMTKL